MSVVNVIMRAITTRLSAKDFEKFMEMCKNYNCTPYTLAKRLLTAYVNGKVIISGYYEPEEEEKRIKIEQDAQFLANILKDTLNE